MLLDEVIALLSDHTASLEAALLKSKAFLYEIDRKELVPWITNELAGYPEDAELPPYRIVTSQPHAQLVRFNWQLRDWVLPTGHLTEAQKKVVLQTKITSSISTIEQHVRMYREKRLGLIRNLPPELIPTFQTVLESGVNIISIWCTINMADVEAILVQVRSRLFDFCLELQDIVGIPAGPQQLQERVATVDTIRMFQTAIFNEHGTVIVGSQNFQVTNQRDDIEGLLKEVAKLGYQETDLEQLRRAVTEDESAGAKPDIADGKTGKWFTKALKEAGKGVVKVGKDVAASVIAKALEHYLGG